MKKLLGTLVCAATLIAGASYAEATTIPDPTLTDWNYTLDSLYYTDAKNVSLTGSGFKFTGSKYTHDFSDLGSVTGSSGTIIINDGVHDNNSGGGNALTDTTDHGGAAGGEANYELLTLNFDYSATSGSNTISKTSSITLHYYYDGVGTEYIYYSGITGQNHATAEDGNYTYSLGDIALHVNGSPLNPISGADNPDSIFYDPANLERTYYGWIIDETTRGTDGIFDIGAYFGITATYSPTETAPTPEPATMLLMGLGLAGLGVVARRRNRK